MGKRDMTSARAKEAALKDKEEKCCGNCCWFCHEDTDGWGFCNTPAKLPKHVSRWFTNCEMPGGTDCGFVSRAEMRHHMAVLLQRVRVQKDNDDSFHPKRKWPFGVFEAMEFAYRYMKVFSKL